jgi:hypothetical protein
VPFALDGGGRSSPSSSSHLGSYYSHRPPIVDPSWLTAEVVGLAQYRMLFFPSFLPLRAAAGSQLPLHRTYHRRHGDGRYAPRASASTRQQDAKAKIGNAQENQGPGGPSRTKYSAEPAIAAMTSSSRDPARRAAVHPCRPAVSAGARGAGRSLAPGPPGIRRCRRWRRRPVPAGRRC